MLLTFARSIALYGGAAAAVVARRTLSLIFLYFLILTLAVVGLGFTTTAAFLALADALGHIYASLIVGCVYLLAALIVLLAIRVR